jgi:hypothetical protein
MPARDRYHNAVKQALIKEGWTITHDPFHLHYGGFDFFIDFGAEDVLAASKDDRQIAVEVKSFVGASSLHEFHFAIGQFLNYRIVLAEAEPDRILYLALSDYVYTNLLLTPFGQLAKNKHQLKVIVFDDEQEVITQWLE